MAKPINLTETWLRAKQKPDRYPVKGRRGMYVWVYNSGAKSYKRRSTRFGWIHIGDYPGTDLADAFSENERLRTLVLQGINPKAPVVDNEAEDARPTFGEVAEAWYKSHCLAKVMNSAGQWRRHPNREPLKSPEYKRTQLDNHLLPKWKDRPFREIKRSDANRRLDEIIADGSPVMANRVGATIAQIWAWALDEDIIDATPMQGLGKRGGRETARERVLDDDQLRAFWTKLDTAGLSDITVAALRFALLTGTRRAEVAGARWREINAKRKKNGTTEHTWIIPPSRTKTGTEHKVPLSEFALEVLDTMRGFDTAVVFPSSAGEHVPMPATTLTRAVERKLKHFGIGKFTPHDLRRTVRSKLAELGVSSVVAKKVLNHALEGMDAVYDRYEYLDEKRDALQLWANHVRAVVAGRKPKVVAIEGAVKR